LTQFSWAFSYQKYLLATASAALTPVRIWVILLSYYLILEHTLVAFKSNKTIFKKLTERLSEHNKTKQKLCSYNVQTTKIFKIFPYFSSIQDSYSYFKDMLFLNILKGSVYDFSFNLCNLLTFLWVHAQLQWRMTFIIIKQCWD